MMEYSQETQEYVEKLFENLLADSKNFYKRTNTELEFSADEKLKIDNTFGETHISLGVVKVIWNLCYVYELLYATFVANTRKKTRFIDPNRRPGVFGKMGERRRQIRQYFVTAKENAGCKGMPDMPPDAIDIEVHPAWQPYIAPKRYWTTNKICSNALFFLLLHEYSHTICPIKGSRDEATSFGVNEEKTVEEIENDKKIEYWCDEKAFDLYKQNLLDEKNKRFLVYNNGKISIQKNVNRDIFLTSLISTCCSIDREEEICAKIGIQVALMFITEKSMDQNSFRSDDHPEVYKRILKVMSSVSKDDDEAWCLLVAAMTYEFSKKKEFKIDQTKEYKDFASVANEFLQYIEDYDKNHCQVAGKSNLPSLEEEPKTHYGFDLGIKQRVFYERRISYSDLFGHYLLYKEYLKEDGLIFIIKKESPAEAIYYKQEYAAYLN